MSRLEANSDSEREEARKLVGRGWEAQRPSISEGDAAPTTYFHAVRTVLRGEEIDPDELEVSIAALEEGVFGRPPFYGERRHDVDDADERLAFLIDSLQALTSMEDDDPAHPWNAGNILFALGRHPEAAHAFLISLARYKQQGEEEDRDEAEWRSSTAYHAAKNLALADLLLSAALLLPQMNADESAEIRALLEERLGNRGE